MSNLGLSGLASGVDTGGLLDRLMALERQPRARMERGERQASARQTLLRDISAKLTTLKTAAAGLRSATVWADTQTVESSDTRVAARRLAGAGTGGYQVQVNQLARAEQRTFDYVADPGATTLTVEGVGVALGANATLADAVAAINTSAAPVYASAVSGQLVLSSKASGAPAPGDVDGQVFAASGTMITEVVAAARLGLDASVTVDGVVKTSSSNLMTNAIAGLELTLKGITTTAATVTVGAPGPDRAAIKAKVTSFVDQYNATLTFVRTALEEKRIANPTTLAAEKAGVLRSDSMLTGVLRQLRQSITDPVAGAVATRDELLEIGVSTGSGSGATLNKDAVSGRLVIDVAKLDAAMDTDFVNVRNLLGATTGFDGFAQRVEALIDPLTKLGGSMEERITGVDSDLKRLRDGMGALDLRLAAKEKRLRSQFAAMETALGRSQAQGSWLSQQIAGLR